MKFPDIKSKLERMNYILRGNAWISEGSTYIPDYLRVKHNCSVLEQYTRRQIDKAIKENPDNWGDNDLIKRMENGHIDGSDPQLNWGCESVMFDFLNNGIYNKVVPAVLEMYKKTVNGDNIKANI
ncbi:MAG: hypothetical protein KAI53_00180 [Candidatus Aenigmarchaeota archaeon]|nr:hypothetical protein [Candidatus Aenigmarchaeota archaeon]